MPGAVTDGSFCRICGTPEDQNQYLASSTGFPDCKTCPGGKVVSIHDRTKCVCTEGRELKNGVCTFCERGYYADSPDYADSGRSCLSCTEEYGTYYISDQARGSTGCRETCSAPHGSACLGQYACMCWHTDPPHGPETCIDSNIGCKTPSNPSIFDPCTVFYYRGDC